MTKIPLFLSIYLPIIFKFSLGAFYILHSIDLIQKNIFNYANFNFVLFCLAILQMVGGVFLFLSINLYLTLMLLLIVSLIIFFMSEINYKSRMIKISRVNLSLVLFIMIKYHYQGIL